MTDLKNPPDNRLSNPEQLDKLLVVVTPHAWVGLFCLLGLIAAVLFWALFGSIPIKVEGKVIVMNQKGELLSVQAQMGGTVSSLAVSTGQKVKKGDLLAVISDRQEQLKFESSTAKVEQLTRDFERLKIEVDREAEANMRAIKADIEAKKYNVRQLEERITTTQGDVDKKKRLVDEGLISPIALHDAEEKLANSHIELETTKSALATLNYNLTKGYRTEELKSKEHELQQAKDEKALLEARHPLYNVFSPIDGTVLELRVSEGDLIQAGAPVAWMEASSGEEAPYIFYGYFPVEKGKRISVGNEVQIELSTVDPEEYGYILGTVKEISGYAVSKESIVKTIHNKELVDYLTSGAEAVVQVLVEPEIDSETGGYKLTSGKTPSTKITTGTVGRVQAIIHRIRPIYYVLPIEAFEVK